MTDLTDQIPSVATTSYEERLQASTWQAKMAQVTALAVQEIVSSGATGAGSS